MAFSIKNANNEGDYFTGITPTCAAGDDITRQLGDPAESSLAEALIYIRTGACSARADAASRTLRQLADDRPRLSPWQLLVNAW